MKNILLCILANLVLAAAFPNELQPGDAIPATLELRDLKSGKAINIASLKGKVVIIDCWATWCSPCIDALKDLGKWQQQFGSRLVVLAVSEERPERLKQFMKNKPLSVTIISDTAGSVRKLFPHRTIPHTIIVGTDGRIKAITDAENVSAGIIQKVLQGQAISLPLKKDRLQFDMEAYFNSDTTLAKNFIMQPAVEGEGTFSKVYPNTSFDRRRITIVNGTVRLLYQLAYRKSYYRMVDEYNAGLSFKQQEKFSVDAWVAEKNEDRMFEHLRTELSKKFVDMEVVLEKRRMRVTVLYADSTAVTKLVACNTPVKGYDASSLSFKGECVSIRRLADYLEDFGKYGMAVEDETGLKGNYRIVFEMEPGKDTALKEALQKLGLYTRKEEREIEVVVIRRR